MHVLRTLSKQQHKHMYCAFLVSPQSSACQRLCRLCTVARTAVAHLSHNTMTAQWHSRHTRKHTPTTTGATPHAWLGPQASAAVASPPSGSTTTWIRRRAMACARQHPHPSSFGHHTGVLKRAGDSHKKGSNVRLAPLPPIISSPSTPSLIINANLYRGIPT
jgi:hypothetical protein